MSGSASSNSENSDFDFDNNNNTTDEASNNNLQFNGVSTNDEMEKLFESLQDQIETNNEISTVPLDNNLTVNQAAKNNSNNYQHMIVQHANGMARTTGSITSAPPVATTAATVPIPAPIAPAPIAPAPIAPPNLPSSPYRENRNESSAITMATNNNSFNDIEILDIDDEPDSSTIPFREQYTPLDNNVTTTLATQPQQQPPPPPPLPPPNSNQPETIELLSSSDEEDNTNNSRKRKLPPPSATSNTYQQSQPQQQQQQHNQYAGNPYNYTTTAHYQQQQGTGRPPPKSTHVPFTVYQDLHNGQIHIEESICSVCHRSVREPSSSASQVPKTQNQQLQSSNNSPQTFYTCDNCGETIHNSCANSLSSGDHKWRCFQSVYPPMCKPVVRARPQPPPDFRGKNGNIITWTEHIFDLNRQPTTMTSSMQQQRQSQQRLSSLGIEVRHSEEMETFMNSLLGDNEALSRINETDLTSLCPLAIDYRGMVVVAVLDGLAASTSGLQQSDVVTSVEFIENNNDSSNATTTTHDLTTMNPADRKALLQQSIPHIRFKIQRPNLNLVYTSRNWLRFMYTVNDVRNRMWKPEFEQTRPRWLWWCPQCANPPVDNNTDESISEYDM